MTRLKGSLVALITPFKNGAVDLAALERLIDFQLTEGTDGLVLCGTTAESPTLTSEEQWAIVQLAVGKAKGRCPIVVGSGTNCTAGTLRLSETARDLGADAVMLVVPYYNKPTRAGLYQHFGYVAERVALPIVLYNIPGRCGVQIDHDTICRLHGDFENITTIKHATGSVEGAARLHAACAIDILSGDDPLTLPLMESGACGVISVLANLLPARVKALTDAVLGGDRDGAQASHEALLPLSSALLTLETNPIPIKTAMAMKGMIEEEFRLPMCRMEPDHRVALQQELVAAGLL